MNLVAPSALLWLIPLAGILIVLYLLKMRRKEMQVSATFLWPSSVYEVRANSLFQRLRFTWLLVLQLLALSLCIFALARPQVRANSLTGEVTVLVIDTSAAMSATDVKPSRLGQAVQIANRFVSAVRPGDRLSIIEAGPTPRVLAPLSDDQGSMRLALQSVQPTDAEADVGEALRLAASLVTKASAARIVLLSDGVFPPITDFAPGNAQLVFQEIGTSGENTAIAAFGVSDTPRGPELYCALKNYGAAPSPGVLNLYADGNLVDSEKVDVAAKGTTSKTIAVPPGAKVLEAKLDDNDFLKSDNYAVALRGNSALSVLLVGPGDLFLERALSLDLRVTLYKAPSMPANQKFDVVVFEGTPETAVSASGVLTFGQPGPNSPVAVIGAAGRTAFRSKDDNDPLMKGVTLEDTFISKSVAVKPSEGAKAVAVGDQGALIVESKGGQRHIFVAFSPLDSDFPLHISFPIFIGNALTFLAPKEITNTALSVSAGRTISLPASNGSLSVRSPDGQREQIRAFHGQFVLRDLDSVGEYTLSGANAKKVFVSFASQDQSDILPKPTLAAGSARVASSNVTSRLSDWWKPLALLALLVLGAEWWLYMRRS